MKKLQYGFAIMVMFLLFSLPVMAQLGDPGDDPDAPIDGGVSLLVAAGIGYGAKKVYEARKKRREAGDKKK
jgi:hypothetical protein